MHEQSCPSSVTVYPWTDEHLAMMDRIGVYSEACCSHAGMNTFSLLQQAALEHIKESIALVRESKALEESAMQVISGVVGANA